MVPDLSTYPLRSLSVGNRRPPVPTERDEHHMSDLIAIGYDDTTTALEAMDEVEASPATS